MPRSAGRRRASTPWRALAGGFAMTGAIFAGSVLVHLPQDVHAHHQALDLVRDGTAVTADTDRVHVQSSRYGDSIDRVDVTFPLGSRRIAATLAGMPTETVEGLDEGWHAAPAGSRYASPLDLLVLEDDPTLAMAVVDVEHWRRDPTRESLTLAGGGLLVAAVLAHLAFRRSRRGGGTAPRH